MTVASCRAVQDGTPGAAPAYRGTRDAVRSIVRQEGWRGLYAGLAPALLGSGAGCSFILCPGKGCRHPMREEAGQGGSGFFPCSFEPFQPWTYCRLCMHCNSPPTTNLRQAADCAAGMGANELCRRPAVPHPTVSRTENSCPQTWAACPMPNWEGMIRHLPICICRWGGLVCSLFGCRHVLRPPLDLVTKLLQSPAAV